MSAAPLLLLGRPVAGGRRGVGVGAVGENQVQVSMKEDGENVRDRYKMVKMEQVESFDYET